MRLLVGLSSPANTCISAGLNEKYATSAPEIIAEQMSRTMMESIPTERPVKEATKKTGASKSKNAGLGGSVSKCGLLFNDIARFCDDLDTY